ncbi:hypothetical protein SCALM49S_04250 [Streptomyces californicus]
MTDFGPAVPDTAERAVLADSVSFSAVLVVLESLSPLERAVFVLREAFGFPYAEIAAALDRTEAAVRQLPARPGPAHVEERRPRYVVDPAERRDLTERFLAAAAGGAIEPLLALLAPDVRLVGDSGGKAKGPRRIIETADKVGRFLFAVAGELDPAGELRVVELNGAPAVVYFVGGKADAVSDRSRPRCHSMRLYQFVSGSSQFCPRRNGRPHSRRSPASWVIEPRCRLPRRPCVGGATCRDDGARTLGRPVVLRPPSPTPSPGAGPERSCAVEPRDERRSPGRSRYSTPEKEPRASGPGSGTSARVGPDAGPRSVEARPRRRRPASRQSPCARPPSTAAATAR